MEQDYRFSSASFTYKQIEQALGLTPTETLSVLDELARASLVLSDHFTRKGFRTLLPQDKAAKDELRRLAAVAFTANGKVNGI